MPPLCLATIGSPPSAQPIQNAVMLRNEAATRARIGCLLVVGRRRVMTTKQSRDHRHDSDRRVWRKPNRGPDVATPTGRTSIAGERGAIPRANQLPRGASRASGGERALLRTRLARVERPLRRDVSRHRAPSPKGNNPIDSLAPRLPTARRSIGPAWWRRYLEVIELPSELGTQAARTALELAGSGESGADAMHASRCRNFPCWALGAALLAACGTPSPSV